MARHDKHGDRCFNSSAIFSYFSTDDISDFVFRKNCKLGKSMGESNMANTVTKLGKKKNSTRTTQMKSEVLLKL